MSSKRGAWISRRGQTDAEAAIDQVIERQPQAGEQVQQLPDERIEDSPYQARRSFSLDSVDDLAQGMRAAGFQGVLIVRSHGDAAKRRDGLFQLVYGHRRRAAWRQVCDERGEPCTLPVVVREVSDERMLVIGAQENLQRQDLDPVEEAQIVAWHERVFSDKNQAEIGAMLGKSSDWVSIRARIHRLPDALKERLRERPRAIGQMLELASLYAQQPDLTVSLADRIVEENLTVEAIRALVRTQRQGERTAGDREEAHNRRVGATFVPSITNASQDDPTLAPSEMVRRHGRDRSGDQATYSSAEPARRTAAGAPAPLIAPRTLEGDAAVADTRGPVGEDLGFTLLLQEVAVSLDTIADQVEVLPMSAVTMRALDQAEQALARIRSALAQRAP